jgi:hypothetical protein
MATVTDVKELFTMSREQLDEMFANSPAGDIPDGDSRGSALIAPGTVCTKEIAECLRFFAWQGKVFNAAKGQLKNRVTPLGVKAVSAKVYKGPSFYDDKECVIIDYADTSIVTHWVRDEIRLIAPHLYLGKVYWAKKALPVHFALEVPISQSGKGNDAEE